jgi:soluble lytic murein transglycosylase-like protein
MPLLWNDRQQDGGGGSMTYCTRTLVFTSAMLLSQLASAADPGCFAQASLRYRIPEALLRAISRVESGGNPVAINKNKNGTFDIGHMQINSAWLPTLVKYGITRDRLTDSCVNTHVGAWILAGNFHRMGYGWKAVGAYNAKSPVKAAAYARQVADILRYETQQGNQID